MELASILAGERFSDRPASVCPIIAGIMRAYNDTTDHRHRQELLRFATESVGTRGNFALQYRRAAAALAAAQEARRRRDGDKRTPPHKDFAPPRIDSGPDEIAEYVITAMIQRRRRGFRAHRWSVAGHAAFVSLVERLIAMRPEAPVVPATPPASRPSFERLLWAAHHEQHELLALHAAG